MSPKTLPIERRLVWEYTLWFLYKKGDSVTTREIKNFLANLARQNPKTRIPTSHGSVHNILSELKKAGLIQYSGTIKKRAFYQRLKRGVSRSQAKRQRKAGQYSLTEAGKRKAKVWDKLIFGKKYVREHPEIPARARAQLNSCFITHIFHSSFLLVNFAFLRPTVLPFWNSQ